jgi:hypothetical protein
MFSRPVILSFMLEKFAAYLRDSDLDNRLLVPLLVSTMLVQTVRPGSDKPRA